MKIYRNVRKKLSTLTAELRASQKKSLKSNRDHLIKRKEKKAEKAITEYLNNYKIYKEHA